MHPERIGRARCSRISCTTLEESRTCYGANLIAYYSHKGENYWAGSNKNLAQGNTERVAEFVQQAIGGDLFEIETVQRYAADHCRLRYFWNYLERI